MSAIRSVIAGCGSYLPEKIVTNDDLSKRVDTSDEWISGRTGIKQRHIAAEGEKTSDLAIHAAKEALAMAGLEAADIDGIVVATATPDNTFPATATLVQAGLGMTSGFAFDVAAVCSGFVYALSVADGMIRSGQAKNMLVIGAETFSRILDWNDRNTCVLFGDGAGAFVLSASGEQGTTDDRGILSTKIHSDGRHYELLYCDGGPSAEGDSVGVVKMEGRDVFKHAVKNLHDAAVEALAAVDMPQEALDWLVPHQANRRIIDSTSKKLGLDSKKVVLTVDKHANTSAASIPLAFTEGVKDGRIQRGELVLLDAMGGGFTWGAALIRY